MTSIAFDTLRYSRRLREAGVPEPQANVQAELMAEAFGFYAENLLTRDHFTEVLNARFSEQNARMEQGFSEQNARTEQVFSELSARMERGFSEQSARIDSLEAGMLEMQASIKELTRVTARLQRTQFLHSWVLGILAAAILIPQLSALMPAA